MDALDTLYIMELDEEYKKARDWIATELRFDHVSHSIGDPVVCCQFDVVSFFSYFLLKFGQLTLVFLIIIPVCLFILDKSAGEYSYNFDHKFVSN